MFGIYNYANKADNWGFNILLFQKEGEDDFNDGNSQVNHTSDNQINSDVVLAGLVVVSGIQPDEVCCQTCSNQERKDSVSNSNFGSSVSHCLLLLFVLLWWNERKEQQEDFINVQLWKLDYWNPKNQKKVFGFPEFFCLFGTNIQFCNSREKFSEFFSCKFSAPLEKLPNGEVSSDMKQFVDWWRLYKDVMPWMVSKKKKRHFACWKM